MGCHNIMGSSAGAGSGEFHLYRQMRRKEQNRQKILAYRKMRDELNEAYRQKLDENQKESEERKDKRRRKNKRIRNRNQSQRKRVTRAILILRLIRRRKKSRKKLNELQLMIL